MTVLEAYPWIATRLKRVTEHQCGARCSADCPFGHTTAQLRFWLGEGGQLVFGCFKGCAKLDILRAVFPEAAAEKRSPWRHCFPGGEMPDFPKQETTARYTYHDENKRVLFQTLRREPGTYGRDKDFRIRRPDPAKAGRWEWNLGDVRRVLYRLPELIAAPPSQPVLVVGGEKDADTLRALGFVATTNVCGERTEWLDSYSDTLRDRHVVVVQDADETGKRHANEVCGSLIQTAASLRRVKLPAKDATAFVCGLKATGVTGRADLRESVEGAIEEFPRWEAVTSVR
jgi:hypothetical protein